MSDEAEEITTAADQENSLNVVKKPTKGERKTAKKLHKKILNFLKDFNDKNLTISEEEATRHLFVGNGGLLCGITREDIILQFTQFGCIQELVMLPQKSFSVLSYRSIESARKAMFQLNGYLYQASSVDTPSVPLYLKYLSTNIKDQTGGNYPSENKRAHINGLVLAENYITEEYEKELIDYFQKIFKEKQAIGNALKHREVVHFGYEFLYGTNNVDPSKPLAEGIPDICKPLLDRMLLNQDVGFEPDQLTVNHYLPGQGIPPHVDTHSAFVDGIVSLSLNSNVCMDFTHPDGDTIPLYLPRRSLLIMKSESRYLWTHGITPRKHDIVYTSSEKTYEDAGADTTADNNNEQEHLTLRKRDLRISLTFRKLAYGPCHCNYPTKCDSQQLQEKQQETKNLSKTSLQVPVTSTEASNLEGEHVYQVYEDIATHFSGTRHSPWPRVKDFLCSLPNGSLIADLGCGNGKYLGVNNKLVALGSDRSFNLAQICRERNFEVLVADCLKTPYRSDCFDACICIAVIHHLSTEQRRRQALQELVRITRVNGLILVYVWAIEQKVEDIKIENTSNETVAPSDETNIKNGDVSCDQTPKASTIEVSEGRYRFQQQDLLVPWHLKDGGKKKAKDSPPSDEKVLHRFYHVFKQGELRDLCSSIAHVQIKEIYFDCGNWCVILQKI